MKTVKLSAACRSLAEYAGELNDDIVVVLEGDEPLAALVPLKNVDRESLALSVHPEFLDLIARARDEFAEGRTLSLAEMREAVRSRRKANKRIQPTARKTRRG